eukprot:EG_transcript_1120
MSSANLYGASAAQRQRGTNDSVKVYVRVRPFNERELATIRGQAEWQCTLEAASDTLVTSVHPDTGERAQFPFERVFWSIPEDQVPGNPEVQFATQEDVYGHVGAPTLESAFEGYNGCIFAYGQTASGKTYTMQGVPTAPGLIPRLCNTLFAEIGQREDATRDIRHTTGAARKVSHKVELSYVEIYMEKFKDLLDGRRSHGEGPQLELYHDPKLGPVVRGVQTKAVRTWPEVERLIEAGFRSRHTATTAMNAASSRSHAILQLTLTQTEALGTVGAREIVKTRRSRINLVDLAGSEKISKSEVQGQNQKEAININKSLTTLGRVIDLLVKRDGHIPYRDSVLTSLLSDSLGGNSRTTMVAALSPAAMNFEETLSTLRYASRTRLIVNVVKVNEDAAAALIRDLQREVASLRATMGGGGYYEDSADVQEMRRQLQQMEALIQSLQQREQQEQLEVDQRDRQWEVEREDLETKHRLELEEMEARADELRRRQEALIRTQRALEEDIAMGRQRDAQEKMRLLREMSRAKQDWQAAMDQQAHAREQLLEARQKAAHTRAQLQQLLDQKAAQQAEAERLDEWIRDENDPVCDMCQRRIARVRCPECEDEQFCHNCDAHQHRAPARSTHKRVPLGGAEGGVTLCEMCGERPMVFLCRDCPGKFCEECDRKMHKNPQRAHHVRLRDGEIVTAGPHGGTRGERFIDTQSQRLGFPDGTFRTVPKFYAGGGGVGPLGPNGAVEGMVVGPDGVLRPDHRLVARWGAPGRWVATHPEASRLYEGGLSSEHHQHGTVGRQRGRAGAAAAAWDDWGPASPSPAKGSGTLLAFPEGPSRHTPLASVTRSPADLFGPAPQPYWLP